MCVGSFLRHVVLDGLGRLSGTRFDIGKVRRTSLSLRLSFQEMLEHRLDIDESSFITSSSVLQIVNILIVSGIDGVQISQTRSRYSGSRSRVPFFGIATGVDIAGSSSRHGFTIFGAEDGFVLHEFLDYQSLAPYEANTVTYE
jgi:hypothetical protein